MFQFGVAFWFRSTRLQAAMRNHRPVSSRELQPRPVPLRNVGGRNFVPTIAIDCKDWAALRRCEEEVELLSYGSVFHFPAGKKPASFSGRRPPKPESGDAQKVNTSDEAVPHSGTRHGGSVDRIAAASWPLAECRTDSIRAHSNIPAAKVPARAGSSWITLPARLARPTAFTLVLWARPAPT
jgi:hypothetical protein